MHNHSMEEIESTFESNWPRPVEKRLYSIAFKTLLNIVANRSSIPGGSKANCELGGKSLLTELESTLASSRGTGREGSKTTHNQITHQAVPLNVLFKREATALTDPRARTLAFGHARPPVELSRSATRKSIAVH